MNSNDTTTRTKNRTDRCTYLDACYLAEDLKCFGYKIDCPLYLKSTGEPCDEETFNKAMDDLIDKTIAKYRQS